MYPQSMFLRRNKKNKVYPCKPQFYYIKVGFKEVKIIYACFRDDKTYNKSCVTRKDSDEPVHPHSMTRAPLWIS